MTPTTPRATPDGRTTVGHVDLRDCPVVSLMSTPVRCIRGSATFDEALHGLAQAGVRHLAVVDHDGRFRGVLTDRQVAAEWARHPMGFGMLPVATVCVGHQPVVSRSASIAEAAQVMRHCDSDAVVVVEPDGRPAGILTTTDLIALLAKPRLAQLDDRRT
jgi:CBS domain-containing protein